ncbi:hypothetical protein GDO81_009584 [Engystomops pustulosus]|uniref:Uncharacterized protein n=1 Tax=Engystomops pustulosus TaxID=76066 RepID=A0AAV7BS13_ENGPU|nr:hypothetical protein GDO81_009584 [Engystomops pustulosus]
MLGHRIICQLLHFSLSETDKEETISWYLVQVIQSAMCFSSLIKDTVNQATFWTKTMNLTAITLISQIIHKDIKDQWGSQ